MVDEIQAVAGVSVYDRTSVELTPDTTFASIAEDLAKYGKISLHPSLKECWFPFARFSVRWEAADADAADGDEVVGGEMALTYLYDVATHDTDLAAADTTRSDRALLQSLRVLDDQPEGGNGTLAALSLIDGQLGSDVLFFDVRTGVHPLELDYCAYLNTLLITKGLYSWQYLFADVDLTQPEQRMLRSRLTRGLDFLERTTPDNDVSGLKKRLAARSRRRARQKKSGDK